MTSFADLQIFFSNPINLALIAIAFITGSLFFKDSFGSKLGLDTDDFIEQLNQKKSRGLMLHQAENISVILAKNDKEPAYIVGIANVQNIVFKKADTIDIQSMLAKINTMVKKDKPLLLIDEDEILALKAAKALAKQGWDVHFLRKGLKNWQEKKLPCINIAKDVTALLNKIK